MRELLVAYFGAKWFRKSAYIVDFKVFRNWQVSRRYV